MPPFAMSAGDDTTDDITIPAVFLYNVEGLVILRHLIAHQNTVVRLSDRVADPRHLFIQFLKKSKLYKPLKVSRTFKK